MKPGYWGDGYWGSYWGPGYWRAATPVTSDAVAVYEAFGLLSRDSAVPLEAIGVAISSRGESFESVQPLLRDHQAAFESLLLRSVDSVFPVEALGGHTKDVGSPIESIGFVIGDRISAFESVQPVSSERLENIESLRSALVSAVQTYEALASLSKSQAAPIEAKGQLSVSGVAPYEGVGGLQGEMTLTLETARFLSKDLSAVLEATGAVRVDLLLRFSAVGSPAPLPAFGRVEMGPGNPGLQIQLTVDPEPYEPYRWPKRYSVILGLQGSVTIQDFGVVAVDRELTLRGEVLDDTLVSVIDGYYRMRWAKFLFKDWLGNEFTVRIKRFAHVPHGRLRISSYQMDLHVLSIQKLFGAVYTGG